MYDTLFAGPALVCQYRIVVKERKYPQCENAECSMHHKRCSAATQFCTRCGKAVGYDVVGYEDADVEHEDVHMALCSVGSGGKDTGIGNDGEALSLIDSNYCSVLPEKTHILLPNVARGQPREFNIDDAFCMIGSRIKVEEEKKWLEEKFAPEIEALKKIYEKVIVDWVCLSY